MSGAAGMVLGLHLLAVLLSGPPDSLLVRKMRRMSIAEGIISSSIWGTEIPWRY